MVVKGIPGPSGMTNAIGSIAGIGLGCYLIAVVYNGNGKKLVGLLEKDGIQYAEFLAAVYILYLLHKSDFGGDIVDLLIGTAVVGLLLKMVASSPTDFSGTLSQFAAGKIGLAETASKLLGLVNTKGA